MISSFFWDERLRKKHPTLRISLWITLTVVSTILLVYFIVDRLTSG